MPCGSRQLVNLGFRKQRNSYRKIPISVPSLRIVQLRDHDDIATRGLGLVDSVIRALKQILGRGPFVGWVKIRAQAERHAHAHLVNANCLGRHPSSDAFQHLRQLGYRDPGS